MVQGGLFPKWAWMELDGPTTIEGYIMALPGAVQLPLVAPGWVIEELKQ